MFVTTQRASAWLDLHGGGSGKGGAEGGEGGPRATRVRTLFATRPFETPAGRCIAVRRVPAAASPRLLVLFESRYDRCRRPRWVAAGQVLSEADAERWAKEGFRRS